MMVVAPMPDLEQQVENAMALTDAAASQKQCFRRCGICDHCSRWSADFAACVKCYPESVLHRNVTGTWERCMCEQLPWIDTVGGRQRRNVVGLRPTAHDPRARSAAQERLVANAARGERVRAAEHE